MSRPVPRRRLRVDFAKSELNLRRRVQPCRVGARGVVRCIGMRSAALPTTLPEPSKWLSLHLPARLNYKV